MSHQLLVAGYLSLAVCAPSFAAQSEISEFRGGGAALCIAAGELLESTADAPKGVSEGVQRWLQVLHVVDGTPEEKESAIESVRASFSKIEAKSPGLGVIAVRSAWDSACSNELQICYIAVHGSEQRALLNLPEDPGAPLDQSATDRLNLSASCLAAAELFSFRKPKARLREALSQVAPAAPDSAALLQIQQRAEKAHLASPGSVIGKMMHIEYLRYLYAVAAGGDAPQQFVNNASITLNTRCLELQSESANG